MCLKNKAHVMELKHDIFKKPYKVTPTLVEEPHPQDPDRTVMNWKVFEAHALIEHGMVSARARLVNNPAIEILSGGVNSTGDRGVALAREANMFQWGFNAPPKHMTEEARRVFVNAIYYIAKFDGHSATSKTMTEEGKIGLKDWTEMSQEKRVLFLKKCQTKTNTLIHLGPVTTKNKLNLKEADFAKIIKNIDRLYKLDKNKYMTIWEAVAVEVMKLNKCSLDEKNLKNK